MKHIVLVFSILVVGCASLNDVNESSQSPETYVGIENGMLIYSGGITEISNNSIFALFNEAEVKPKRLLITSQGGDIDAGLALGQWVKDHNLEVEVISVCASSCANYVFPAASTKYLRKDSVLLWHGSAWQSNWNVDAKNRESFDKYITEMPEVSPEIL